MKIKEAHLISSFKKVFSKWNYIVLGIFVAVLFYTLDIFFTNFKVITAKPFFQALASLPLFMASYVTFFPIYFFIGLVILSLTFGILFSMIAYKTKMLKSASGKTGILVSLGIFLGILAPGCPACGIGILSVLGIGTAAISFLPFKGFSLVIASIAIMTFSIYKISGQINRGIVCEIPLENNR